MKSIFVDGFTRIIEIDEGVWEIVDDKGDSIYTTHCQLSSCGQPMFSKRLRKFYICKECAYAHHQQLAADKHRKSYETRDKTCFCGTNFIWDSRYVNRKYCSAKCCSLAAWRLRLRRLNPSYD